MRCLRLLIGLVALALGCTDHDALLSQSDAIFQAKTAQDFKLMLADLRPQQTAMVFFYTNWCPHCLRYIPTLVEIANQARCLQYLKFTTIECSFGSDRIDVAQFFQVNGFPTMMVVHNSNAQPGRPHFNQWTVEGALPATLEDLVATLRQHALIPQQLTSCQNHIGSPDDPSTYRAFKTNDRWLKSALSFNPKVRLHDGIRQLQAVFLEWVIDETFTHERAMTAKTMIEELAFVAPDAGLKSSLMKLASEILKQQKITKDIKFDLMHLPGVDYRKNALLSCRTDACGLWMLLHSIAVNNALQTHPIRAEVLTQNIRDFVDEFFVCDECRKHFRAAFDAGDAQRREWLTSSNTFPAGFQWTKEWGLALWLWRFHNIVTYRTAIEDIAHGKNLVLISKDLRFPPKSLCPECYTKDSTPFTISDQLIHKCAGEDSCTFLDFECLTDFDLTAVRQWLTRYFGLKQYI
ncbi:MAG: uncharacterized protein KVP18_002577 [Porospora cf. gigantea A]|uniref:uncharacterized protein n=1 Tax=Porospora cf. gigantea A TaxID=2853593 RepID=UPI0035594518|nr:MAG: hypothetical protein KVP18_002577 [Porospora cf. gigantea A]